MGVPLIFLAVKGNVSKSVVFVTCALASYSAGWMGYVVGRNIRRLPATSAYMDRLSLKYPEVPDLMERRQGIEDPLLRGVALAALLPVPLAIATWTAGSFHMRALPFALAALMRLPKICVFVLLSRQT